MWNATADPVPVIMTATATATTILTRADAVTTMTARVATAAIIMNNRPDR